MADWLIFATWAEDDDALRNSHWIAHETARRAPSPPRIIERADAVRSTLETVLARNEVRSMTSRPTVEGVALFGHAERHAFLGSDDEPALDLANVHLLARRWAHAFACNAGRGLVPAALDADLFVGYDVAIPVGWTHGNLPEPVRERVSALVTSTTLALLEGVRSKVELQRRAALAAEALVELLCGEKTEVYDDLLVMAQQLVERMVLSR